MWFSEHPSVLHLWEMWNLKDCHHELELPPGSATFPPPVCVTSCHSSSLQAQGSRQVALKAPNKTLEEEPGN